MVEFLSCDFGDLSVNRPRKVQPARSHRGFGALHRLSHATFGSLQTVNNLASQRETNKQICKSNGLKIDEGRFNCNNLS
jgi:hypothetical protein